MIRVIFGFIWVLYKFVFKNDWLGNRRKRNMLQREVIRISSW